MSGARSHGAGLEQSPVLRTAEEELRARVRQQEATGRLGLAALSGMRLPDLMDEAVDVVTDVLRTSHVARMNIKGLAPTSNRATMAPPNAPSRIFKPSLMT